MSGKDYLANLKLEPGDKLDFGVKGMRWGIRRSRAELRGNASGNGTAKAATTMKSHGGTETSSDRYNRLLAQAKQKGGNSLTDEELRFVTQRGDAIARVNRLNSDKPNWLADASKHALNQAAKKTMKTIAEGVSKKYISDVLLKSVTG